MMTLDNAHPFDSSGLGTRKVSPGGGTAVNCEREV